MNLNKFTEKAQESVVTAQNLATQALEIAREVGARFAVVPGAGHWVQYEAADRFNALIAEFAAG